MSSGPVLPGDAEYRGMGRRRWQLLIASIALAAGGYLLFSLWGGWHEVVAAIVRVGWTGLFVLLGLSALNYLLRFARWQVYLRELGASVPLWESLTVYLAGFALTTTPGKAGEAIRSVFLRRRGMSYVAGMAAFISERLSDLTAIVVLACIGLADHPGARPLVLVGVAACGAVLVLIGIGDGLSTRSRPAPNSTAWWRRTLRHALASVGAARVCHRPAVLVPITVLSVIAWSCEAWAFHLLLGWLGLDAPWTFSFFVYAISMLAGALSFLPGGLGSTEGVMVGLLLWAGHGHADSIAATVLIRIATLWFAVFLGAVALGAAARIAVSVSPPAPDGGDRVAPRELA